MTVKTEMGQDTKGTFHVEVEGSEAMVPLATAGRTWPDPAGGHPFLSAPGAWNQQGLDAHGLGYYNLFSL